VEGKSQWQVSEFFPSLARCLIPNFDGAVLSSNWRDALWARFFTGAPTTTEAVRRAIQNSQESLRALANRYGINQKTMRKVAKSFVSDRSSDRPEKSRGSTVLSVEEEAVVVAFRRHTLLPLDDCLYALQATIPHLTRSSLHRCLQRHGISPVAGTSKATSPPRKSSRLIRSAFFHIDIAEVRNRGRKALPVRGDRPPPQSSPLLGWKTPPRFIPPPLFLNALIQAVPYKNPHRPDRQRRAVLRPGRRAEKRANGARLRMHMFRQGLVESTKSNIG